MTENGGAGAVSRGAKRALAGLACGAVCFFGFAAAAPGEEFSIDDVSIEGNLRIESAAIRQQLKQTSGAVSSESISADVKTLYRTGFFDQVTASIVRSDGVPARTVLRLVVVEKPTVRRVFIKGNQAVSESDLSEIFVFDARRFLDKAKIEALIKQAVQLYQSKGYYDVTFEQSASRGPRPWIRMI